MNDSKLAAGWREAGIPAGVPLTVLVVVLLLCCCGGGATLWWLHRNGRLFPEPKAKTRRGARPDKYRSHAEGSEEAPRAKGKQSGRRRPRLESVEDAVCSRVSAAISFVPTRCKRAGGARAKVGNVRGAVELRDEEALPRDWEARVDEQGDEYFWNTRDRTATWSRPLKVIAGRKMPEGWKSYTDEDGNRYYVNMQGKTARERQPTWTHPGGASECSAGSSGDRGYAPSVDHSSQSVGSIEEGNEEERSPSVRSPPPRGAQKSPLVRANTLVRSDI